MISIFSPLTPKWSRLNPSTGSLILSTDYDTGWQMDYCRVLDLINVHLFHDESNLALIHEVCPFLGFVQHMTRTKSLGDSFPTLDQIFQRNGSLTTPGCYSIMDFLSTILSWLRFFRIRLCTVLIENEHSTSWSMNVYWITMMIPAYTGDSDSYRRSTSSCFCLDYGSYSWEGGCKTVMEAERNELTFGRFQEEQEWLRLFVREWRRER